nr:tyrosine-type recombinase/integrase [Candidatus Enterovibrio luxaltus]
MLTPEHVKALVAASGNKRNKFLICLLYETGMRIGETLGLRHADIHSWDKVIQVIPRRNENRASAKSNE